MSVQVATTFGGITKCGEVGRTDVGDTASGDHHDFESGGISAHLGRCAIHLDAVWITAARIREVHARNLDAILGELTHDRRRASHASDSVAQVQHRILVEEGLLQQQPYLQMIYVEQRSGRNRAVGGFVMPLTLLWHHLDERVTVVQRDDDHKRKFYSAIVDGREQTIDETLPLAWGTVAFRAESTDPSALASTGARPQPHTRWNDALDWCLAR